MSTTVVPDPYESVLYGMLLLKTLYFQASACSRSINAAALPASDVVACVMLSFAGFSSVGVPGRWRGNIS